jgi:hypothetical protein
VLSSRRLFDNLGGHSDGDTPLPIPNREVKPASADGTRGASPRESRTPPSFLARQGIRWRGFPAIPKGGRFAAASHLLNDLEPSSGHLVELVFGTAVRSCLGGERLAAVSPGSGAELAKL